MRAGTTSWPRWWAVCVIRRVITQARDLAHRRTSSLLPTSLVLVPHDGQALLAVFPVLPHEFQSDFIFWQRRRSDVNAEHGPKPDVFADTLMHHMFVETASPRIGRVRPDRKILVGEHTPCTNHLDALRLVILRLEIRISSRTLSVSFGRTAGGSEAYVPFLSQSGNEEYGALASERFIVQPEPVDELHTRRP